MRKTTWYERLAAVPGVAYSTPPGVYRPDLPARFLKPKLDVFTFDSKRHESLSWPTDDGSTSASPAQRWLPESDSRNPPPALILKRVYEQLELPGVASDYHFALLQAYEALAPHARRNPDLHEQIERLCLIDIALLEQQPDIVRDEFDPNRPPYRVPAYERLIYLYERNGLLDDALSIARRAAAAGHDGEVERLEELLAAIRAEDA